MIPAGGGSTHAYVWGINTNLSNKYFNIIIDCAKGFARKSWCAAGASTKNKTAESSAATKGLDKCSQLKDRPCLPDDEEIEYDGADEEDSEEDWRRTAVSNYNVSSALALTK